MHLHLTSNHPKLNKVISLIAEISNYSLCDNNPSDFQDHFLHNETFAYIKKKH